MTGIIFDIQRFSVHDGPGIRTTIFLKGCSLNCLWCHNPEGIAPKKQLMFASSKCIKCGACLDICKAHDINSENLHVIDRTKCKVCGKCAEICPSKALKICGKEISSAEIAEEVLKDISFYTNGGGVTFSGGEALLQTEFVAETAKIIKEKAPEISVAVDTCGNVPWEAFERVLPYCDLSLYDIKAANSDLHKKGTGKGNELILDNLKKLDLTGKDIRIRIPLIPNFNDGKEEQERIKEIIVPLSNVKEVTIVPYHTLGVSKYEELGMEYKFDK